MANAYRDENSVPTLIAASNADGKTPVRVYADPTTHRLLVDVAGGSGTVTDVSVVTANGFAGTVANSTTTPAITLTTTVSGILKGNGTAMSAGVAGDVDSILPTQTGNNGKFLTTNGTTSSWGSAGASGITIGTTTITSGTNTRILYDNAGVVGEYTLTGTGTVVAMQTSPSLITPALGVATATTINKVTLTTPATGSTLTIADGKTLTASNTMTLQGGDASVLSIAAAKTLTANSSLTIGGGDGATLAITAAKTLTQSNTLTYQGTDGSTVNFGTGGTVLYSASTIPLTVGTTTIASGTSTRILYDNAGVLGEYTLTGSGTVVAMQTAPTFATSITTPSVLATANDSGALGASGTAFSDLFLASGAVINFNAGNVTLTHSAGILTQNAGELRITSANVGTNADSVPTLSSTSTLTNKTLTSPTIQTTPVFAAGTNAIYTVPTSDDTATGVITNAFNSGYTSSAIGDLVYLDSSATWQKTDANAAATYVGLLGIALEVKASGNALKVLLQGFAYCSTAFPTFTIGGNVYMSETAGAVTQTQPTTTDAAIRVLGYAVHADKMWFNPSPDYITHT